MPEPSILKINEIFWSFQGEGLRAGYPSIFVRMAGCTYGCEYCDTKQAWETGIWMSIDDIWNAIKPFHKQYPQSQVVLTGGEPLEQNLAELVIELKKKDFYITIETNGIEFNELPIDWWTVSPKDVVDYSIHDDLLNRIDEVKLIVNKNLNIDVIRRIRQHGNHFPIFLQPDSTDIRRYENVFALYEYCQSENIADVRPGVQLHKIYNVL